MSLIREYPESEGALESVLRNAGNIDTFLDTFFSFLTRRTDFFIECPPEGGPHGFPKGQAEALILDKFKKFNSLAKPLDDRKEIVVMPPASSQNIVNNDSQSNPKRHEPSAVNSKAGMRTEPEFDSHNGRVTDKYSWSQTIDEMDVTVPVSQDVKKGKQVNVVIGATDLTITLAGSSDPIVQGKLAFPVKKDDCYWSLVPGEGIRISLQKAKERWWQSLLEGEEPLDMSKIEAVRPMEDLDEEEQMKIQELCWNEERKRQGLPTSEEMKMEKILKEAWNAEGSPFKGQPFDPSIVSMCNQGSFPPGAPMPPH